ncbi:TetR/AcrR family transcriptional regulator, partial [Micromonospora echinofusca]|uniref:TetR/AcrR family transcriptional regulator n=1 Tax=Micromonospora echinofusca TaxID=47858 RepID=UPI003F75DA33
MLTAARERFAADGYERATIRAIAADAGIDPAMVMRYYGNKEKLFAAAAEFDLRLPDFAELSRAGLGATGLPGDGTGAAATLPGGGIGATVVRHMLRRWEGDETLFALLRAAVSHEAAAERMREIFGAQLAPAVAQVCPDPADAARRAGLVATQMLGLALTRYVLRLPPVVAMSPDELAVWLGPTLDRYLTT